jgi:adenylosuccinate lyase
VLLALADRGASREDAYEWVQRNATRAWKGGEDFKLLLSRDPDVSRLLPSKDLESCFDIDNYLRHVGTLFQRAFDAGATRAGK